MSAMQLYLGTYLRGEAVRGVIVSGGNFFEDLGVPAYSACKTYNLHRPSLLVNKDT